MKLFETSRFSYSIIVMLSAILLATCKPERAETPLQIKPAFDTTDLAAIDSVPVVFRDTSRAFIRTRFTRINRSFFEQQKKLDDSIFTLQLFRDLSVRLVIDSIAQAKDSTEVWTLHPTDVPYFGVATIVTSPSTLYASIQIHTTVYEVYPVGKDIVRIREIDQTKFLPEAPPLGQAPDNASAVSENAAAEEDNVITVLLVGPTVYSVYCTEVYQKWVETIFTANLNVVFSGIEPSGVSAVVKFACTPYTPVGGDLIADLEWLRTSPAVAALRDQHKADLVCLIIPDADACGRSFPNIKLEADRGFAVVVGKCALSNYTFAHELGHAMGMRHDRQTDNDFTSTSCAWGSIFKIKPASSRDAYVARTVMTYRTACDDCPVFPFYSNPMKKVFFGFEIGPMGVGCDIPAIDGKYLRANNRQQLINAAPIVSGFR